MRYLVSTLAALALALPAVPAAAQRASAPSPNGEALVISASNRSAAADAARGAARRDSAVRAGDVLRYTLTFRNIVNRPIRGVKLENPIPAGLQFVVGSAKSTREDAKVEFSADGGKTFSPAPSESVVVDGLTVVRPIPAERFTHVRWVVDGWVQPRTGVVAEYEARLAPIQPQVERGGE
jgi:uncharacterized repeat protein (TIGR01451 family)